MEQHEPGHAADELLTRREHLRAQRRAAHSAPARIGLRLGSVVVFLAVLITWVGVSWFTSRTDARTLPEPPSFDEAAEDRAREQPPDGRDADAPASPEPEDDVVVHIAGAVHEPQVLYLEAGARVVDAVNAAGGLTEDAAPEGANLAAPAQDGDMIYVPTVDEVESGQLPPAAEPGSSGDTGSDSGGPVDLNLADAADLEQLSGIGPALAERIIAHRETHGGFNSLEELAAVSGIGPAIIESIGDDVTW